MPSFNPRTRTGCDKPFHKLFRIPFQFQPTHPHGVRLMRSHELMSGWAFQPTHPHGVRLEDRTHSAKDALVSTHAPARGATAGTRQGRDVHVVSTHAPARGATYEWLGTVAWRAFQPTHPHGVRRHLASPPRILLRVSTHAPARGATFALALPEHIINVSTHAPARGATCMEWRRGWDGIVSTHAPARGATNWKSCLRIM